MNFPDRCVIWPDTKDRDGYAAVRRGGVYRRGHRFFFELFVGQIPKGMHVLHSCHNRACVNPAHLRLGTHAENMQEMLKARRHSHGEKSPNAKLTDELVRYIRASAKSLKELVAELGASDTTISRVRRRETWRHVP